MTNQAFVQGWSAGRAPYAGAVWVFQVFVPCRGAGREESHFVSRVAAASPDKGCFTLPNMMDVIHNALAATGVEFHRPRNARSLCFTRTSRGIGVPWRQGVTNIWCPHPIWWSLPGIPRAALSMESPAFAEKGTASWIWPGRRESRRAESQELSLKSSRTVDDVAQDLARFSQGTSTPSYSAPLPWERRARTPESMQYSCLPASGKLRSSAQLRPALPLVARDGYLWALAAIRVT